MTRVVVLGGGFGGLYTALKLDRVADRDLDVTLVDRNNFFLFTPMLTEVATSGIDARHIVNPIRRLFRRVRFVEGEVTGVDFDGAHVGVRLASGENSTLPYDHLVIALGSVSNSFKLPGIEDHSVPVKTLADAIILRNQTIQRLEEADVSPREHRAPLLTWVVVGGNLTGVELTGELIDFVRDAARAYPTVDEKDLRVLLVEAGPRLMPDLSKRLAGFAAESLSKRGVEIHLNSAVKSATDRSVTVDGLGEIPTRTLVWTAGVAPTPFVGTLGLPLHKGRVVTDMCMRIPDRPGVWAVGDVAAIPDGHGGFYPPTAQHAMREGAHVAKNILRVLQATPPRPFRYRTMGMLATLGHRNGVGDVMGLKVSGFLAWWIWRSYYLFRLPRIEKRARVLFDWTLDLVFPRDIVQLKMVPESDDERSQIRSSDSA